MRELGGELPEALTRSGEPLDRARELLSPEDYERAVERGNSMTIEQAVAFALDEGEAAAGVT